jgi:tagatose 6-phosphate kinase
VEQISWSKKDVILFVCLNPAIDKIVEAEFEPRKKVIKTKNTVYAAGGKGVNAARVIKILGGKYLVLGMAGGAAGKFLKSLLKDEGIAGRFVDIKNMTRINLTLIAPARGKETHFVDPGPLVSRAELKKFRDLFTEYINGGNIDCAVFSGSLPPGAPSYFYKELIKKAREKGIKTALDTSGAELKEGIKAKPDIIKPNGDELEELSGSELRGIKKKMDFARRLKIPEALVSLGERGSFVSRGGEIFRAEPMKTEGKINSVGAGDALLAGYIYSRFIKNSSRGESLLTASACAASNLLGRLPGKIYLKDIRKFKKEAKITRRKN